MRSNYRLKLRAGYKHSTDKRTPVIISRSLAYFRPGRLLEENFAIMNLQPLAPYLSIIEIILAVTLTALVLLQSKGQDLGGFLGGGGGDSGAFRTRRGIEVVLHRLTILISVLFFINTFLAFMAWGQAV